jgi:hypothetical protein
MSELLTDKEQPLHRAQPGDNLSTVARARTLTVLSRLEDGGRKRSVLEFLYESHLIDPIQAKLDKSTNLIKRQRPIVNLNKANLSGADLNNAFLRGAFLRRADLSAAILEGADLILADLSNADLGFTDLSEADLIGANLSNADLKGTFLIGANLNGANLRGANLRWANLRGARGWTTLQLREANSLEGATEGATMPDGQMLKNPDVPDGPTFEEWLKDRERRGEDGENSSPS